MAVELSKMGWKPQTVFLNTEVRINGGAIVAKTALDPTIAGVGIGYRFWTAIQVTPDVQLGAHLTMHRHQQPPSASAASRKRRAAAAILALSALLVLGPRQAQAFGDSAEGRQLATNWCSGCHQVDPRSKLVTTDTAPSFQAIAAMPSTTSISIQAFLRTSHDVMPNFRLTEPQIDDVDAYILSQRARPPR